MPESTQGANIGCETSGPAGINISRPEKVGLLSPWSQSIARATRKGMEYQVAGSMQIRYLSARKGSKYFIALIPSADSAHRARTRRDERHGQPVSGIGRAAWSHARADDCRE